MAMNIRFTSLFVCTKLARCAHSCRYCSISKKNFSNLAFERFAVLTERLIDWVAGAVGDDLRVHPVLGNSNDIDESLIVRSRRLSDKAGSSIDVLPTGGLRFRSDNELRSWLAIWKENGIKCVHATFLGHGAIHDRWNGRRGDFEFLLRIQRIAADLGLQLGQSLLLTKSTMPLVHELIQILDTLPGKLEYRWVFPIGYIGLGTRHEDERITEDIRDELPNELAKLRGSWFETWRSEREWRELISNEKEVPATVPLKLEIDDANIDELERTPVSTIIADLKTRTHSVYAALPSLRGLAVDYGDSDNRKIYMRRDEIERLWVSRFLARSNTLLDIDLTELGIDH
jgi:hypothetical protein